MHEQLEAILGIHFQDPALLTLALTHRSYIYESRGHGQSSNERLEFLGDSILALISADFLYRTFPQLSEGELTDVRAFLVRTETLADFAQQITLGTFLLMGKGEQSSGAGQRVQASTFEALLGAIYLDQGLDMVKTFLLPRLDPLARRVVENRLFKDNKSRFQEKAQASVGITPAYRLVNQEGPAHNRVFTVDVLLGEKIAGSGQGRNKQSAEQEAARVALINCGWND